MNKLEHQESHWHRCAGDGQTPAGAGGGQPGGRGPLHLRRGERPRPDGAGLLPHRQLQSGQQHPPSSLRVKELYCDFIGKTIANISPLTGLPSRPHLVAQ